MSVRDVFQEQWWYSRPRISGFLLYGESLIVRGDDGKCDGWTFVFCFVHVFGASGLHHFDEAFILGSGIS